MRNNPRHKKPTNQPIMKLKNYLHPATLFLLLSLAVTICSWIGSGYGWQGVQNLLSVDGIRWMLRNTEDNFMYSPALAIACILFFGFGLVIHSGLGAAICRLASREKILSRKQKRALTLSALAAMSYTGCCCLLVWGPWGIVRSVTGMFAGSPLEDGILIVISLGIGISGVIYGFAVDNYRRDKDVYLGMSCLFSNFAEYFVSLFFIEQFFAFLSYSGLTLYAGISVEIVSLFYILSCILPIFLYRKRA